MSTAKDAVLSHLDALESEAVHILREVAGEFERPASPSPLSTGTVWRPNMGCASMWPPVRHTTRTVKEIVQGLGGVRELTANNLGRITLRTAGPLALDDYAVSRRTGAFI